MHLRPRAFGNARRIDRFALSIPLALLFICASAVSADADPIEVARLDEVCCPTGVAYVGSMAFVSYSNAGDPIGLRIYDYSVPTAPAPVSELALGVAAEDIAVEGSLAVVAAGLDGLVVIDVSNAAAPFVAGSVSLAGEARDVELVGAMAYVGTLASGLRIVDVSNPAMPVEVGSVPAGITGEVVDLAVIGTDLAICAGDTPGDGTHVLQVFDASNPASPSLYYQVWLGDYTYDWDPGCQHIATDGIYFYTEAGLQYNGCCTPSYNQIRAYSTVGEEGRAPYTWPDVSAVQGIGTSGPFIVHAIANGQLSTIDFSAPSSPAWVGDWTISSSTGPYPELSGAGDLLHVTSRYLGLVTIDTSTPAAPTAVSVLTPFGDDVTDVVAAGNLVYAADQVQGLRVIDVSQPNAPVQVAALGLSMPAVELEVVGQRAFVVGRNWPNSGLFVIDITTPAAPVELGSITYSGVIPAFATDGNTAVIRLSSTGCCDGVRVIDVSSPTTPIEIASLSDPLIGTSRDVALSGSIVIVGTRWSGVRLYDISVPGTPVEVGAIPLPSEVDYVKADGALVYAISEGNLQIIDITDPVNPDVLGEVALGSFYFYDLRLQGTTFFGATRTASGRVLLEVDVSDPNAPVLVGQYLLESTFVSSAGSDGLLVTADGFAGIGVYVFNPVPAVAPLLRPALGVLVILTALVVSRRRGFGRRPL